MLQAHVETHPGAYWETRNNGKALYEARMDIESCADTFDFYASLALQLHGEHYDAGVERFMYLRREPLGVCGGIGAGATHSK